MSPSEPGSPGFAGSGSAASWGSRASMGQQGGNQNTSLIVRQQPGEAPWARATPGDAGASSAAPTGAPHLGAFAPWAASSPLGGGAAAAAAGPAALLPPPLAQRLAAQYEQWEAGMRCEAEERISGFRPLNRLIEASGTADDWTLLRRVKSQRRCDAAGEPQGGAGHRMGGAHAAPHAPGGPHAAAPHAAAPGGGGGAMKRAASDGTLAVAEHQPPRQRRVHLRQDWEPLAGAAGAAAVPGYAAAAPSAATAAPQDAAARGPHAAAAAAAAGQPLPAAAAAAARLRHAPTAPALSTVDSEQGGGAPGSDPGGAEEEPPEGPPSLAARLPRPATADDLSLAAGPRQLEAVAARLLQSSRTAIQNAQAAVQETATNCSQNLQQLGALFSAGMQPLGGSGAALAGGPLGAAAAGAAGAGTSLVPWYAAERGAAAAASEAAGASPWELIIPRYMRPSASAEALLAGPDGAAACAAGAADGDQPQQPGAAAGPGAAAFAQLVRYFERLEDDRRRRARARAGGAYSSLREPGRSVAIVTTASLPWMTGTAVNPLLRAAYLAAADDGASSAAPGGGKRRRRRKVTLLLPWLNKSDQEKVFPGAVTFESPADQEAFVREWAQKRTGLPCDFAVTFYPGRYAPEKGSILPVGDITQYIPDSEADVAVLEEPEHLNWYHHGARWTDKFRHVVGVMHTNYLDYARREEGGEVKEALLRHINAWVCRIYCHKVVKLSDAVQPLPREDTMFVHGVSPAFLEVGRRKAEAAAEGREAFGKGAYFLGKVLWAKGYTELLDRLNEHASRTGEPVKVDVYGSGPDLDAVQEEAARRRLALTFNGAKDHADTSLQDYKVFINPSLSDVVATTTAEALAMGKWVVCAHHPSNAFFSRFPNCLVYKDSEEFSRCLRTALSSEPRPLSPDELNALTWEAATHRFLDVAELKSPPPLHESLFDGALAAAHNLVTGIEPLRIVAGAGAGTRDAPAAVTGYVPSEADVGGLFDDAKRAKKAYGKAGDGGGGGGAAAPAGGGVAGALAEAAAAAEAEAAAAGTGLAAAAAAGAVVLSAASQQQQGQQPEQQQQRSGGFLRRRRRSSGAGKALPAGCSDDDAAPRRDQAMRRKSEAAVLAEAAAAVPEGREAAAAAAAAAAQPPRRRWWRRLRRAAPTATEE